MLDMGFLPDIRRILAAAAAQAADAVLHRDDAGADREARARDAATIRPRSSSQRKAAPAAGITQAVYPVAAGPQGRAAGRAAREGRDAGRARLHAHQAPRRPARRSTSTRAQGVAPGASTATARSGSAPRRSSGFRTRQLPRAGRDRHRGARHRRRGARPRGELRRARGARGLRAPRRPHRPRRSDRRRVHLRVAAGGERSAPHRARDRQAPAARERAGLRGGDRIDGGSGARARAQPARRTIAAARAASAARGARGPAAQLPSRRSASSDASCAGSETSVRKNATPRALGTWITRTPAGVAWPLEREHRVEPMLGQLAVVHHRDEVGVRGVDGHRPVAVGHGRGDAHRARRRRRRRTSSTSRSGLGPHARMPGFGSSRWPSWLVPRALERLADHAREHARAARSTSAAT